MTLLTSFQIKQAFPREEDLCDLFAQEMKQLGWEIYPETAGFDLLLVWPSTGHQLGVEAKLSLNAKVIDQIVPDDHAYFNEKDLPGPDFRAVIVPTLTEASHGLAKVLRVLGIEVFDVADQGRGLSFMGSVCRYSSQAQWEAQDLPIPKFDTAWFDHNPAQRCELPSVKPTVRAGIPSPIRLSPWKVGALKVLADLELDGFTTAKAVRAHGIDPRRFCATDGWLISLGEGKWGLGKVPRFDHQHPEQYQQILSQARQARQNKA